MSQTVTLELPEMIAIQAHEVAIEWLNRAIAEPPVELLPDNQILALCELQMEPKQNEELSDLLAHNREGGLNELDRVRLDDLIQIYRRGLLCKAQALKIAVERGLRPPPTNENISKRC